MKKLCAILLALLLVPFGAFAEENKDAFSGRFGDKIDGALNALLNRSQSAAQRAAELLCGTGLRVTEIAMQCGFQDASYFARAFRQVYGCGPTEYRRKARREK